MSMDSNDIKTLIETVLKHMQIEVRGVNVSDSDGRERFAVETPDSHLLIGTKGAHLLALNHLVKKMVIAKDPEKNSPRATGKDRTFFIDVNGYQEAAALTIKNTAKIMDDPAPSFKTHL